MSNGEQQFKSGNGQCYKAVTGKESLVEGINNSLEKMEGVGGYDKERRVRR